VFKLYSRGCEYAIRALIHVPPNDAAGRFQARDVCDKAGIPEAFSRKVFQALVQGGFLVAARGPGGGYELAAPAEKTTLYEVIQAVDGEDTFDHCIMGLPECGSENPCPLHNVWAEAKDQLLDRLKAVTLAELVRVARSRGMGALNEEPA